MAVLARLGFEIDLRNGWIDQSLADSRYYPDFFCLRACQHSKANNVQLFLRENSTFHEVESLNKVYLLEDQVYTWRVQPRELQRFSEEKDIGWLLLGILMNLPFVR